MARSAPGKHTRKGISLVEAAMRFGDEAGGRGVVRAAPLAGRDSLYRLWLHEHPYSQERTPDAYVPL